MIPIHVNDTYTYLYVQHTASHENTHMYIELTCEQQRKQVAGLGLMQVRVRVQKSYLPLLNSEARWQISSIVQGGELYSWLLPWQFALPRLQGFRPMLLVQIPDCHLSIL